MFLIVSLDLEEMTGFFKKATSSVNEDQDKKLDEQMEPIPHSMHGAVTRTKLQVLQQLEDIGENLYNFIL